MESEDKDRESNFEIQHCDDDNNQSELSESFWLREYALTSNDKI